MPAVERLSKRGLKQILSGKLREEEMPAFFVIKFYSNGCHYCHALQEDFTVLSERHTDAHFYAFNIDDEPSIQNVLNFRGVPTICTVLMERHKPRIRLMPEPLSPHKQKWYYSKDINSFIEKEKIK